MGPADGADDRRGLARCCSSAGPEAARASPLRAGALIAAGCHCRRSPPDESACPGHGARPRRRRRARGARSPRRSQPPFIAPRPASSTEPPSRRRTAPPRTPRSTPSRRPWPPPRGEGVARTRRSRRRDAGRSPRVAHHPHRPGIQVAAAAGAVAFVSASYALVDAKGQSTWEVAENRLPIRLGGQHHLLVVLARIAAEAVHQGLASFPLRRLRYRRAAQATPQRSPLRQSEEERKGAKTPGRRGRLRGSESRRSDREEHCRRFSAAPLCALVSLVSRTDPGAAP